MHCIENGIPLTTVLKQFQQWGSGNTRVESSSVSVAWVR